jgi:flagellar biogenesis protein FliO
MQQLLQRSVGPNETVLISSSGVRGLADWILKMFRVWRGQRETTRKQLRLVETLPLGGKRQLMLVTCAGESFLVGGGVDSVEAIVRLKAETPLGVLATSLDEPCK